MGNGRCKTKAADEVQGWTHKTMYEDTLNTSLLTLWGSDSLSKIDANKAAYQDPASEVLDQAWESSVDSLARFHFEEGAARCKGTRLIAASLFLDFESQLIEEGWEARSYAS